MTSIYLITNNCFLEDLIVYNDTMDLDEKREARPLSVDGEKVALSIAKKKIFDDIDAIYSSSFFSMVDCAKYLANKTNIDLIVDKRLNDRLVGDISQNINLRYLQEHDFDYKLPGGESLNDVKARLVTLAKEILRNHEDSKVAVYTHNSCILSLLSIWCEKAYNLDDKMIYEYNNQTIVDGLRNDFTVIEMIFDKENLINIKKFN